MFVLFIHNRPWLSVRAETILSTHSLFKLQSVTLIVLLQRQTHTINFDCCFLLRQAGR